MQLSEAVLLGAGEIRLTNGHWYFQSDADDMCYGCLVGSALLAVGAKPAGIDHLKKFHQQWPWRRLTTRLSPTTSTL